MSKNRVDDDCGGSLMMRLMIIVFILMFFSWPAMSEVFRWTDNEGRVHFGDEPPQRARGLEQVEILPGPSDEQVRQAKALAAQREAMVRQMEQERLQRQAEEEARKLAESERQASSEKPEKGVNQAKNTEKTADSGDFEEICPSGLVRNGECISRGPVNLPAYNKPNIVRPRPIIIEAN